MKKHCCEQLYKQITFKCDQCADRCCPDQLVGYNEKFNEYGLFIHDRASGTAETYIVIDYCPWCGTKLPLSKREEWFEKLESLGYTDPIIDDIPEAYKNATWWEQGEK